MIHVLFVGIVLYKDGEGKQNETFKLSDTCIQIEKLSFVN
mgnify:CR=1 FL=1